jgi:hypothetical protein
MGMQMYSHFGKLAVGYKIKHTLTIKSNNQTPWYLPKEVQSLCPHKNLHMDVYRSCIYNCPKLRSNQDALQPVYR